MKKEAKGQRVKTFKYWVPQSDLSKEETHLADVELARVQTIPKQEWERRQNAKAALTASPFRSARSWGRHTNQNHGG